MIKFLFPLTVLCAVLAVPFVPAEAQTTGAAAPTDDGLFVALGGRPGIDGIVGEFVPRLVADPRTGEFFKKSDQAHFARMLEEKFCEVSGGGCAYTGVEIRQAHADMDISRADFNAVVEVLQAAMDARGVPFATQNRLLARLAPMHRDIVH